MKNRTPPPAMAKLVAREDRRAALDQCVKAAEEKVTEALVHIQKLVNPPSNADGAEGKEADQDAPTSQSASAAAAAASSAIKDAAIKAQGSQDLNETEVEAMQDRILLA